MASRCHKIGNNVIHFDQWYYIAYAGGTRELPAKEQKEWNKTILLPELLKVQERRKIPMQNNPNVVPIMGIDLLSFIRELKFIPLFDTFFEKTHTIKLTDIVVYESIKAKSYEIALREGR
jgi:hypothetical protein